jgi:hypothetical protein
MLSVVVGKVPSVSVGDRSAAFEIGDEYRLAKVPKVLLRVPAAPWGRHGSSGATSTGPAAMLISADASSAAASRRVGIDVDRSQSARILPRIRQFLPDWKRIWGSGLNRIARGEVPTCRAFKKGG